MPRSPLPGLLVLAATTFIGVVTESLPIGLLPQMADDLGVRESSVGLTVSGYALVVALTAAPLTSATASFPRRRLLVVLLAIYAACNVATALAPTFAFLAGARVIGALAHGIFWSIVIPFAAALVPPARTGWGASIAVSGGSIAVAAGVPIGTAIGAAAGWREAFLVAAGATVVIGLGALALLPDREGAPPAQGRIRATVAEPFVRRQLALIVLIVLAYFALFTYVAPYVQQRAGISEGATSLVLALGGFAGVAGTLIAGRALDRHPLRVFLTGAAGLVVGMVVLLAGGTVGAVAIVAFVLVGAGFSPMPIALQAPLLQARRELADTAVSLFTASFNVGIFAGGLLGGLVLDTAGLAFLPLLGLPLILLATGLRVRFARTPASARV